MCEVKDLLLSKPLSQATRAGHSENCQVWKGVSPLPVTHSSLVTFQSHLLAAGGDESQAGSTSEVRQYNEVTDSWSVISQMRVERHCSLAVVLPNNTSSLLVCGGGNTTWCNNLCWNSFTPIPIHDSYICSAVVTNMCLKSSDIPTNKKAEWLYAHSYNDYTFSFYINHVSPSAESMPTHIE